MTSKHIAFTSLARELETVRTPAALLSLSEYVACLLDETQRATRDMVALESYPCSGRGSDAVTIIPGKQG